jgi:phospholipid-binding lipoprotein MlaA
LAEPSRMSVPSRAPAGVDRAARATRAGLLLAGTLLGLATAAPASRGAEPAPASQPGELAADPEFDAGLAPMGDIDRSAGLEAEAEFETGQKTGQVRNPDPWEKWNRKVFWFNERADVVAILPIAKVWRFATPEILRRGIDNFNELLAMPVIFANGVFQLKPKNAVQDVGRIVYNATFGLAGFIDIASMVGIPQNDEDFGQTLGFWGAPPGPYLVLPFFGPSNIRDGIGRAGDTAATYYTSLLPIYVTFIVRGVELVNLRARFIEEVDENRRESFDYYVFLRAAYLQNREMRVGRARERFERATESDDDLYYFDEEELEEGEGGEEGEEGEEEDEPEEGGDPSVGLDDGADPSTGSTDDADAAGDDPHDGRIDR